MDSDFLLCGYARAIFWRGGRDFWRSSGRGIVVLSVFMSTHTAMEDEESTTECWNGKFVEREITQKVFYLHNVS